jgi:Large polyvalent protein associated domain 29
MPTLISATDTAVMIRKALKEAFPDVKFSVRTSKYSGGASVSVRWKDGPNDAQVNAVTGVFKGSYFDGQQDMKGNRYAMVDGKTVSFGADYIHASRIYSRAFCEKIAARFPDIPTKITGTDEFGWGISGVGHFDESRPVMQALARLSDRLRVAPSPTAGKVINLGNDGYSDVGALRADI